MKNSATPPSLRTKLLFDFSLAQRVLILFGRPVWAETISYLENDPGEWLADSAVSIGTLTAHTCKHLRPGEPCYGRRMKT